LDLGLYTNALYDYINFQWNDSSVFKEIPENILSDHFDIYLMIFSPLSLIFGTYTLPIVQIIFMLFGGLGVYNYFISRESPKNIASFATLYYLSFFGVFSAISFDYHSNVIAASIIPWFFYLIQNQRFWKSSIVLALIIISKENVSLWMAFICLGLAIEYWKVHKVRNYLLIAGILSLIYFWLIISVVMPALSNTGNYPHFNYGSLGDSPGEAIIFMLTNPLEALRMLFVNHINQPEADYVKLELHVILITSGILLLIKKPQYLLMLVPIFFQKLFHDKYFMWGVYGQYCIEFAPIMAIGIFKVISEFKSPKLSTILSIIIVVLSIGSTIRTLDSTIYFTDKSRIRFYQMGHYKQKFDVKKVHEQLFTIPKAAIVSAQSPFLPHLSLRDNIYTFPIIRNAEFIVISKLVNPYPLDEDSFNKLYNDLINSFEWEVQYNNDIVILKKVE